MSEKSTSPETIHASCMRKIAELEARQRILIHALELLHDRARDYLPQSMQSSCRKALREAMHHAASVIDGNACKSDVERMAARMAARIAELETQLQTVHEHVRTALEMLGVDVSVDGYIPDSWTLVEQCKAAGDRLNKTRWLTADEVPEWSGERQAWAFFEDWDGPNYECGVFRSKDDLVRYRGARKFLRLPERSGA